MLIKTSFKNFPPFQLDSQIRENKQMFHRFGYSDIQILNETRYFEKFESLELDKLNKEEMN